MPTHARMTGFCLLDSVDPESGSRSHSECETRDGWQYRRELEVHTVRLLRSMELQDQRGEDELHREIQLAIRGSRSNWARPKTVGIIDSR